MIFHCYVERNISGEVKPLAFHSEIDINLDETDEEEVYDTMVERINEKIVTLQSRGIDWVFYNVIQLELYAVEYIPLREETYIPLPKELANKKAINNMKNSDSQCFLWCILRALNPRDRDQDRLDTELKKKINTINMEGIEYPVSLKDLGKFEKQNPTISITVLGYEGKSVYPLRNSNCI